MASLAWLLALLSLTASARGFAELNDALEHLEKLEQEVEEQSTGLKLLIEDGKRVLLEQHDLEQRKSMVRMEQDTEDILKEATKRKCPLQLKQDIATLRDSTDDRWNSCMKMTEKLIEFENMTLILYKDYLSWRPTFCNAANNVTFCFDSGNFLTKATCAYDSMSAYLDDFTKIKTQMVGAVNAIHDLVLKSVTEFKACFGGAQEQEKELKLRMLEQGCPPRRGKPLVSMLSQS